MAAPEPWELRPFDGIGPVRLGMPRDQVIELLGPPDMVIGREPLLEESYHRPGVQIAFDGDLRVAAITALPDRPVRWHLGLTGRSTDELTADLARDGHHARLEKLTESLLVHDLGLILFAPEENGGIVEAVTVTRRDYPAVVGDPDAV